MKQMKITITETSVESKLKALAYSKAQGCTPIKDAIGVKIRVEDYVKTHNIMSDEETGEVQENECITLITDKGLFGTNSATLIKAFDEILENSKADDMDLKEVPLTFATGKTKTGNSFNTIEIDFESL